VPRRQVDVGGTSGGLGEFLVGMLLVVVGFYMIFTNTIVYTSFWSMRGYNLLGPLIILFLLGVVCLFVNSASVIGWLFSAGSIVAILVGIIMNLRFQFKGITLLSALIMFALPAAGFGLLVRSLRAHGSSAVDM
jgi:hypothetical protein